MLRGWMKNVIFTLVSFGIGGDAEVVLLRARLVAVGFVDGSELALVEDMLAVVEGDEGVMGMLLSTVRVLLGVESFRDPKLSVDDFVPDELKVAEGKNTDRSKFLKTLWYASRS